MSRKTVSTGALIAGILVASTIGVGIVVGVTFVKHPELRIRMGRSVRDVYETSRKKVVIMSEDVAARTAQMTKNPKVNQEWVAHQWESIGY